MLIKYNTADAVKDPYSLDLLQQKSFSVIPEQERELLLYRGCKFIIGKRKIWRIWCDMGRIFLLLMKSSVVQVGCLMKYQLSKQAGQHNARSFFLKPVVIWKCQAPVGKGAEEVARGGFWRTCLIEPCQRGPSTGPQLQPGAESSGRDLRYSLAGTVLTEMVRDFQEANSWLKKSVCQNPRVHFAGYTEIFRAISQRQWNLGRLQNCKKFWLLYKGEKVLGD